MRKMILLTVLLLGCGGSASRIEGVATITTNGREIAVGCPRCFSRDAAFSELAQTDQKIVKAFNELNGRVQQLDSRLTKMENPPKVEEE